MLTLANLVFPVINRSLGLAIDKAHDLRTKYETQEREE
jgi:hypothetical protein